MLDMKATIVSTTSTIVRHHHVIMAPSVWMQLTRIRATAGQDTRVSASIVVGLGTTCAYDVVMFIIRHNRGQL